MGRHDQEIGGNVSRQPANHIENGRPFSYVNVVLSGQRIFGRQASQLTDQSLSDGFRDGRRRFSPGDGCGRKCPSRNRRGNVRHMHSRSETSSQPLCCLNALNRHFGKIDGDKDVFDIEFFHIVTAHFSPGICLFGASPETHAEPAGFHGLTLPHADSCARHRLLKAARFLLASGRSALEPGLTLAGPGAEIGQQLFGNLRDLFHGFFLNRPITGPEQPADFLNAVADPQKKRFGFQVAARRR